MSTLLRVLVIVITVLSAASLYFAFDNFNKRQILLGRNAALVKQVGQIAQTIEKEDAKLADGESALELLKDTSPVADRVLPNPEKEDLLETYPCWLETQNLPTLSFASDDKQIQLMTYYAIDEEGKIKVSPVNGQKVTTGPGTMQELLDLLGTRAIAQQATLNKTRAGMSKLRTQLTDSVEEINQLKLDGRVALKDLTERKEEIVELNASLEKEKATVAKQTGEIRDLKGTVSDLEDQVETLGAEKAGLTDDLAKSYEMNEALKEEIRKMRQGVDRGVPGGEILSSFEMSAGDKGKVIEANDEFKFAIIEFSNDAMREMLGEERENALPQVNMNVRRTGRQSATGDFVTRVKLRQPVRGKNIVVADILSDWQQSPVEKGDVVFF
ncbi:MAG: hypothetical protein FWG50_08855 [Kiritimatiellaeota bacterium]|nr:hypothetical protein [Kiritimatiellota bacterium]